MSISEANIIQAVKDGMKAAVWNSIVFSEDFASEVDTEYLITVNIAQALSQYSSLLMSGSDLRIVLEESTKAFATKSIPLSIPKGPGHTQAMRTMRVPLDVTRSGRIDVALYRGSSRFDSRAYCPIEVKGFRPQAKLLEDDLLRNAEFLSMVGNTGTSFVEFSIFCALYSYDSTVHVSRMERRHYLLKTRLEKIIRSIGLQDGLRSEVDVFDAGSELLNGNESQEEYESMALHHFVGVVIVSRRSNAPTPDGAVA